MKEFKVDLEVITPMFLHGADGIKAEIRAPSIKGVMRYWWRAAKAEDDIEKLRNQEEIIFGSTKARSKVQIKVLQNNFQKKEDLRFNPNETGLNYLLPRIFVGGVRDGRSKEYYEAGSEFSIILSAQDEDTEQLKQAIASLWLVSYFGSLGSRSRRGGGNLAVKSAVSASDLKLNINFIPNDVKSETDLSEWIRSNYRETQNIINPSQGTKEYSNLRDARLKIFDRQKTWKESLDYLGNLYKNYRREYDLVERSAIGLPMRGLEVYGATNQSEIRSASRLIFKIIRTANVYYPVIILLRGPLLPRNYKINVRGKRIDLPSDNVIEDFFGKFESKYEVRL